MCVGVPTLSPAPCTTIHVACSPYLPARPVSHPPVFLKPSSLAPCRDVGRRMQYIARGEQVIDSFDANRTNRDTGGGELAPPFRHARPIL
jgi:hypothetical protein